MPAYRPEQLSGLGITIPPASAFHADLSEHEIGVILMFALSSLGQQAAAPVATVTPSILHATDSGTVAAGARLVEFIFSFNFEGSVLGETFAGATDSFISFPAPPGTKLAAIPYTVTAGSVRISKLV